MNLTIKPGAALDDAAQIDAIVMTIERSMEELDNVMQACIPSAVDTTWSNQVKENWDKYYKADVPAAMQDMKFSASNLRLAVEQAMKFDQEQ